MSYVTCSLCDFKNQNPFLTDVEIKPLPGVEESVLQHNYCKNCKCYTRWFMGVGTDTGDYDERINDYKESLVRISHEINILKSKKKTFLGTLLILLYYSKIKNLEKDKFFWEKKLELENSKLEEYVERTRRSRDFYNIRKPDPKCLLCGNTELLSDPIIHECGGVLTFVPDTSLPNFSFFKYFQFLYDERGNVKMMELNFNIEEKCDEWIESKGTYFERVKVVPEEYEKTLPIRLKIQYGENFGNHLIKSYLNKNHS